MRLSKKIIASLFLTFLINVNASAESISTIYAIISDVYSDTVPKGVCHVQGKVYEAESQARISEAFIGDTQKKHFTKTDAQGNYHLNLAAGDSTLYFFKIGYEEIVCWNYKFKSQHIVTIDFLTGVENNPVLYREEEKPVIYLYSDKPVDLTLTLKPKGHLTFSYPDYADGWLVRLKPNQQLEVASKAYPYLFWEGVQQNLNFKKLVENEMEGYFINTDSTVHFFESTLTQLGVNQKEQTDFITYWAPRLKQYNFAAVQLLIDDAYTEHIAAVNSTVQIDAQRRVYILFKGYERGFCPYKLKTPAFTSFERKGLTLIEWGGTEL